MKARHANRRRRSRRALALPGSFSGAVVGTLPPLHAHAGERPAGAPRRTPRHPRAGADRGGARRTSGSGRRARRCRVLRGRRPRRGAQRRSASLDLRHPARPARRALSRRSSGDQRTVAFADDGLATLPPPGVTGYADGGRRRSPRSSTGTSVGTGSPMPAAVRSRSASTRPRSRSAAPCRASNRPSTPPRSPKRRRPSRSSRARCSTSRARRR